MLPQQYVQNWRNTPLGERQSYQMHFAELCQMVGHEAPSGSGFDAKGNLFQFEYGVKRELGGQGFADVFYENHFAVEYKRPGKHKDLADAYQQLLQYRERLNNPPLLIVCDVNHWQIHTNWPNTEKKVYEFTIEDIANRPSVQQWLQQIFTAPDRLHPRRNSAQVTTDAASVFKLIAENMRDWQADPDRIAHFLTKLVFCLFAEDVSLLPSAPNSDVGIFSEIVGQTRTNPHRFVHYMADLFKAMADGGEIMFRDIPYFNGALFEDVNVEELSAEALTELERASRLNWASVEPAIFGTLFERSLDPSKRAQLGAHYTSREDILLIVEPVLMQPLRREWEAIKAEAAPIREKYDEALLGSNKRNINYYGSFLEALREKMLHRLREIKVLDPACGSGNFLYVSLQLLMDMEKVVIYDDLWVGLNQPFPEVHPRQMYGIEVNAIAHALASIVVWIGYIQWRENNGYSQAFKEPILEALHQNIRLMDAIMTLPHPLTPDAGSQPHPLTPSPLHGEGEQEQTTVLHGEGEQKQSFSPPLHFVARGPGGEVKPTEPEWPEVDVIVGNPPFLGGNNMRSELGNEYVDTLRGLYEGRLPGGVDLVCYWYEKARAHIQQGKAKRAGLLATNSIRGGVNREVLKRIKQTGNIFMAWSDREWILAGAAVRVSMVGFDDGTETERKLDGMLVSAVNPDLTAGADSTQAKHLIQNEGIAFRGNQKGGAFDIDYATAKQMIETANLSRCNNRDVVKLWWNGLDVTGRPRNMWLIDFGIDASLEEAQKYEAPFAYIRENVKTVLDTTVRVEAREHWWIHIRPRPEMRAALASLSRFIATPHVSKHRVVVWMNKEIVPDHQLIAIAREDDYFFGVLHSRLHEVWSLRMGTWMGVGNDPRYTPTTTFETFPFPWTPGKEDTAHPAYQAISAAAKQLHEEREVWLNPPGVSGKALEKRTLTNLYNALNVFRGKEKIGITVDAGNFAPRLDDLHSALDKAVCDAYGWPHDILGDEEEILRRLLALNLERAGAAG